VCPLFAPSRAVITQWLLGKGLPLWESNCRRAGSPAVLTVKPRIESLSNSTSHPIYHLRVNGWSHCQSSRCQIQPREVTTLFPPARAAGGFLIREYDGTRDTGDTGNRNGLARPSVRAGGWRRGLWGDAPLHHLQKRLLFESSTACQPNHWPKVDRGWSSHFACF